MRTRGGHAGAGGVLAISAGVGLAATLGGCARSVDYPADAMDGVPYAEFPSVADRALPALLIIGERADGSTYGGNGVAIAPDLVLTAEHVADDRILEIGGVRVRAEIVARGGYPEDHYDDWALVRVEPALATAWVARLGPEPATGDVLTVRGVLGASPKVGQALFAPHAFEARAVSPAWLGVADDPRIIVLDRRVWRSLSGAPVFDAGGRVVGVLTKAHHRYGRDGGIARRLPRAEIDTARSASGAGEPTAPTPRTDSAP